MEDTMASKKADNTAAPEKRDATTDDTVTELAHVDANTTTAEMREMSGATDADASTQQKDALEGLKRAKDDIKHPDRDNGPENPHVAGPGSDVA